MSQNEQNTNPILLKSTKRKHKESCRLIQKLYEPDDADIYECNNRRSATDCPCNLLRSMNCHRYLIEKFPKQQRGAPKKQKTSLQKKNASVARATVPITPQMIRVAVKELQTRRVYISSGLIASHLRRCYPIENDPDELKKELHEKLNCAVSVGLIAKCGDDKYCIPTLRQQATSNKTALTSFWETYYKNGAPSNMEQLFTLEIPRARSHKKGASIAPKPSCNSKNDDFKHIDEFDKVSVSVSVSSNKSN